MSGVNGMASMVGLRVWRTRAWRVASVIVAAGAIASTASAQPSGKKTTGKHEAPHMPATTQPAPAPQPAHAPRSLLHPMIVEVLYAVPTGVEGDANKDGVRSATGDEFVELVNPHDKPLQLLGYSLSDESQGDKTKVRFTFPALELKPGEVVVVFNGYGSSWSGPVGDSKAPPPKKHPDFSDAYVFTMRVANSRAALNNSGDSVTLYSPENKPVQRVKWGTSAASASLGEGVLDEIVPDAPKGSVQRIGVKPGDAWRAHSEISNVIFSPGRYDVDISTAPKAETSKSDAGIKGEEPQPGHDHPVDPKSDGKTPGRP